MPGEDRIRALARTVALLQTSLEASTDAILVTDGAGRVVSFNTRFADTWAISAQELAGADEREVFARLAELAAHPEEFRASAAELVATDADCSFDVIELADGRSLERSTRVRRVDGQPAGRVWSFRDVTERRRLELHKYRLAAVVESSNDAIYSKTLDGVVSTWNAGAERLFGYAAAEIVGKSVRALIPAESVEEELAILAAVRDGRRAEQRDSVRVRKDGTHIHVALSVSPVFDDAGRIVAASTIARDVTERRRVEEERKRLLRAEQIARAQAEHASVMKDEFLATLSHELRTPLTAILGWCHVLRMRQHADPDVTQGLTVIERNARVQTQLIEDLLDMSRIISGKLRFDVQLLDVADVVKAAVASIRPSAESKSLQLHVELEPRVLTVRGDPDRLQQCVWNLLTNAIKFTPRGGAIRVALARANDHVEIAVRDDGQGIAPEFLPHLFERFRQADASTTRRHGGLGLGLSIVRSLVELHGGSVRAASAGVGQGSEFVIELPVADGSEGSPALQRGPRSTTRVEPVAVLRPSLSEVTVLAIDDEPDARALLRRLLEDCGARVLVAASASEGLEIVRSQQPHVILSDIGMPDEDGYDFIAQLRALRAEEGGRTPAAALSAFARIEDRTRSLRAGYQAHLAKPVEPAELTAVVASLALRH